MTGIQINYEERVAIYRVVPLFLLALRMKSEWRKTAYETIKFHTHNMMHLWLSNHHWEGIVGRHQFKLFNFTELLKFTPHCIIIVVLGYGPFDFSM